MQVQTPATTYPVHASIGSARGVGWLMTRRSALAVGLGLLVALGVGLGLDSGAVFKARAIVGVTDDGNAALSQPSRDAIDQSSAAAVLSRSVLARASVALRDKGVSNPKPGLVERLAVAVGLADANSQAERMEQSLAATIVARRGPTSGTVAVEAGDAVPERAASLATAVAEAFIVDQDEASADMRRARDAAATSRFEELTDAADAAHRRLAAFGSVAADPARERADAAAATLAAKTRLEAFRTVVASGSPPLGAQTGLPPSVGPLQADYLELKRQLMDASRTLGERHTTVIGLQDGLRQSAKTLTTEWKRLEKVAETDWMLARDHEAALSKSDASLDAKSRQAVEEARRAAKSAADAIARFQANRSASAFDDRRYRLVAAATVPTTRSGLPNVLCILAAALAGCCAASAVVLAGRRPLKASAEVARPVTDERANAADSLADPVPEPVIAAGPERVVKPRPDPASPMPRAPGLERSGDPVRLSPRRREPVDSISIDTKPMESNMLSFQRNAAFADRPAPMTGGGLTVDPALRRAVRHILPDLARIRSDTGSVRTVFVGAIDPSNTTPIALALGREAAAAGQRVLVIEAERPKPLLAAATGLDEQPVLVDVLGLLKIALRDDEAEDLFLAPVLPNARRLAADLAQRDDVVFVDDAAEEFDLVIVDGGQVDGPTARDWFGIADASIRVARFASKRDDETFLHLIGGTVARFIGTIAATAPMEPVRRSDAADFEVDDPIVPRFAAASAPPRPASMAPPSRVATRPPAVARTTIRRKIGAR